MIFMANPTSTPTPSSMEAQSYQAQPPMKPMSDWLVAAIPPRPLPVPALPVSVLGPVSDAMQGVEIGQLHPHLPPPAPVGQQQHDPYLANNLPLPLPKSTTNSACGNNSGITEKATSLTTFLPTACSPCRPGSTVATCFNPG
jgi:hypothetical protein